MTDLRRDGGTDRKTDGQRKEVSELSQDIDIYIEWSLVCCRIAHIITPSTQGPENWFNWFSGSHVAG